ncbi:Biopolymer transport protein ExbD/TolR [Anatilimnocola aggregata]|uniref:Biopolymer transport protein ExbD/TolR n=1 Tax=Anatilimnocola aggregata TaxID=2528021 RepID=A0A517YM48_9BACT|nr:biopolymer transporter ExbD [Anatilimnocola aggregata]QDU31294.1 Biopolymer transport protein ExbD/TolR [Anatilimnocola aggregata]
MKIARRTMKADVPSTAMGDIAFNLLIFFVILARAQDDSHIQWKPAQVANLENNKGGRVTVVIDVDGKIFLNGQQRSESELSGAIGEELGDAPAGERTVMLKVDKDVTAPRFEPVIEAISQAGGELIHILEQDQSAQQPVASPASSPSP